jgi:hypothetical protein
MNVKYYSILVNVYDLRKILKFKYYKREHIKEGVLCHKCSHHMQMKNTVYYSIWHKERKSRPRSRKKDNANMNNYVK